MNTALTFQDKKGFLEITTSKTSHIINYSTFSIDDIFENDFTFITTVKLSGNFVREGLIRIHGPVTGLYSNGNYLGWETATIIDSGELQIESIGNIVESLQGVCCVIKKDKNIRVIYNGRSIAETFLKNDIYSYSKDRFNNFLLGATSIHHDEWQEGSDAVFFNFAAFTSALSDETLKVITDSFNFRSCKSGLNLVGTSPKIYYDFEDAGAAAIRDVSGNGNVGMMYYANVEMK